MEGQEDSSSRPCLDTTEIQTSGGVPAGVGTGSQFPLIREMDESQLVGVPLAVVGLAAPTARAPEQTSVTVPAEIKSVAIQPVGQQVVGKRKRGRPPKVQAQALTPKPLLPKRSREEEEDVCFICFDGGSLVLCDRKGCPKAYHPSCIKRDESFFRSKAKWNCGWHICSVCQKASYYMCYTCTYSLCKGCTRGAEYVCVRGNKGFCTTCMRTIMLIENKDTGNKESIQVDFDDKSSWEYLFKVYWVYLKSKLSLTLNELIEAKNPWQGMVALDKKQQSPCKINDAEGRVSSISEDSFKHLELKIPKELPILPNQNSLSPEKLITDRNTIVNGCAEWASRDLLEFVGHMRNGDTSFLSQFDVQALLLDYIKINNLRDPRRKSQIVCDFRLKNLFGKPRVGHIEMLKLLEYHFLAKEDTEKNAFIPAGFVGSVATDTGVDHGSDLTSNQNKRRKTRKKVEERASQTNLDEYAAINVHNINLIYLRRNLIENLLEDMEKFQDKIVGSIVRIRVSCNDQKQDIHRLVQVVGTSRTTESYKIGGRTVDIMLEVLNLDKKETISIDGISNQEFSEDECRRLRQSIKCGLVKRFTVGEIQRGAIALKPVKLDNWLETETLRLNHLRDLANEKGRKKELRECIEKLQLLTTPEERQRRLTEIPEVHADPKMNPDYESEDDMPVEQGELSWSRHSKFNINENQPIYPKRRVIEDGPVRTQQLDEKRDMLGPDSCPKNEYNDGFSSGWSNDAMLRLDFESSAVTSSSGNSPPADSSEMEKMWHYRDPNGKIQGPFSMMQLRKWSTTGYFPDDMRIWINNEQDGCILLADALNGQLFKASLLLHNFSMQSQEPEIRCANRLCEADGGSKFTSGTESDGKIEGTFQNNDSRIHFNSTHEYARSGESGSISSDWSTPVADSEMQPREVKPCELSKNNNPCSGLTPVGSKPQSFNLEQPSMTPPLNQVKEPQVKESNCVLDEGNRSSHLKIVDQIFGEQDYDRPSCNESSGSQSTGQNLRPPPLDLDLNQNDSSSILVPVTRPNNSSQLDATDLLDLPSPAPNPNIGKAVEMPDLVSGSVPAQEAGMSDLPSPTIKPMDEDLPSRTPNLTDESVQSSTAKPTDGDQNAEPKQPVSPKIPTQDSGPNLSNAASLVVGGARLPEITNAWGGYSPAHTKPSTEGWDSGIVSISSLKRPEAVGHHIAFPNLNSEPVTHSSPSQGAPHASNWQAVVSEPIEFSTLAEESVSDLLAEVDAMESGLASPTSGMKYSDERNDCFSSIEELSPTPETGKSDACSGDIQFPSQPTVINDPVGVSQADAFDPLKRTSGHSTTSSEGETKSADAPIDHRNSGSDIHPSQSTVAGNMARGRGLEPMDTGWAAGQGNMNMGWGGPTQGFSNGGWGPSMGPSWGNPNFSVGAYNGNVGWDSPRRYGGDRFGGSRDWGFQGPDVGYGRGRPTWSRQAHGGSGGGYSRPPPKGQRVCKFYESGHCKKGASCDYLHP